MAQRMFVPGFCGLMLAVLIGMQARCTQDRSATVRLAAATLEFRILAERDSANPERTTSRKPEYERSVQEYFDLLSSEGPTTRPSGPYRWFRISDRDSDSFLSPTLIVAEYGGAKYVLAYDTLDMGLLKASEGWWVQQVSPVRDSMNRPAIDFMLGGSGPELFGELTKNNLNRQLAIFVDNEAVSTAVIRGAIYGSGQITGQFSHREVIDLVNKLSGGGGE